MGNRENDLLLKGKFSVLIVEDDVYSIKLLHVYLKNITSNLYDAKTASDAIEIMHTRTIDMVLLDLKLPDKNGVELLQEIKTAFPSTIVIGQSGSYRDIDITEMEKAGSDDFIEKPVSQEIFKTVLAKFIQL